MSNRILVLAGDGVGPEITRQAMRVLGALRERHGLEIELDEALMGGIAVDQCGNSLP